MGKYREPAWHTFTIHYREGGPTKVTADGVQYGDRLTGFIEFYRYGEQGGQANPRRHVVEWIVASDVLRIVKEPVDANG